MNDYSNLSIEVPPPSFDAIMREAGCVILGGPTDWGNSWWKTFSRCPYEAALIRAEGWGGPFSEALFTGALFHECIARVYTGKDPLEPCRVVALWAGANAGGVWSEYAQTVWAIASNVRDWITAYQAYWRPMPQGVPFDVNAMKLWDFPRDRLLVEFDLSVSEPFPYSMRGDIAVICEDWTGKPAVAYVDHKTTSNPHGDWQDGWWLDGQMLGAAYLWDRVMVPRGAPPCRYILINGIVKPTSQNRLKIPGFIRQVYPVRDTAVALWEKSIAELNARRIEYEGRASALAAAGVPAQLHDAFPQSGGYAACFDRRYGHGRCSRVDHCLTLGPTPRVRRQAPPDRMLAPPPAEPIPTPLGGAPAEAPLPVSPPSPAGAPLPGPAAPAPGPAAPAPGPELAPPPVAPEPAQAPPAPAPDGKAPFACVACPDDPLDAVVSLDKAHGPPVPAAQTAAGWPYYIGGIVAWSRGRVNEAGEAVFEVEGHVPVCFAPDRPAYLCAPIIKPASGPAVAPPAPEPEPSSIGEAFVAGVGPCPVTWIGAFNAGGAKLLERVRQIVKAPGYYLCHVGKEPHARKLKAFVARPDGDRLFVTETKKGATGSDVWLMLERLAPALPPAPPMAGGDGEPQSELFDGAAE